MERGEIKEEGKRGKKEKGERRGRRIERKK